MVPVGLRVAASPATPSSGQDGDGRPPTRTADKTQQSSGEVRKCEETHRDSVADVTKLLVADRFFCVRTKENFDVGEPLPIEAGCEGVVHPLASGIALESSASWIIVETIAGGDGEHPQASVALAVEGDKNHGLPTARPCRNTVHQGRHRVRHPGHVNAVGEGEILLGEVLDHGVVQIEVDGANHVLQQGAIRERELGRPTEV